MCKKIITKFVQHQQKQKEFGGSPKRAKLVNINYLSVNRLAVLVDKKAIIVEKVAYNVIFCRYAVKIIYNYTKPSVSYIKILSEGCE